MARYMANFQAMLKNLVDNKVYIYTDAGAPTNGTSGTLATLAGPGSLYIDNTAAVGIVYVNQNTQASPTWVAIGTTLPGSITLATGSILVGTAGVAAALDGKTSGQIFIGNGTTVVSVAVTGDVTISNAGVTAIGAGKVTDAMHAANTLTTASFGTSVLQQAAYSISSANITGTSAGQLGHANGVVLVAAQGAHNIIEFVSATMHYKFGTAQYTGGGNITVNNSAGGTALTGLVSFANSVGNAASKSLTFVPLTTVAIPNVENGGIALVSASAPTQPGTAAGTITGIVTYRVHPTGF